ncbi:MAG: hypothetical protein AAF950_06965 [Pseudomonadota bacterium]
MSHIHVVFLTAFATVLSGCSTKLDVGSISQPTSYTVSGDVDGIPFREYRTHTMHLFVFDESDKKYRLVSTFDEVIASPDAVYYLATDSQWLSDGTLTVKPRSNGTLSTVSVSSENKTIETIDSVVGEYNKLLDAEEAIDEADRASALACVEAEVALDIAQETLNALPAETTVLDRTKAEGDVLIAEIKKRNACIQE